jgi:hypothetical protein
LRAPSINEFLKKPLMKSAYSALKRREKWLRKVVHAIFTGVWFKKLRAFRIGPVSVNGLGKFQCHARLGAVPLPPPVFAIGQAVPVRQ